MGHCKNNVKGKFTAIKSYLKKQEKHQIDNLTLYLKQLEKEEQTKLKVGRRKEIINIREEIKLRLKKKTTTEKEHMYTHGRFVGIETN